MNTVHPATDLPQDDDAPLDKEAAADSRVFDWIGSPTLAYEQACLAAAIMRRDGGIVSRARLEAVLFLADVSHVDTYGRPLYGENWTAGWCGPVPSILSAVLDGDVRLEGILDEEDARCIAFARDSLGSPHAFGHAFREPDMDRISQSDEEAIIEAAGVVAALDPCTLIRTMRHHPVQLVGVGNRIPPEAMVQDQGPMRDAKLRGLREIIPYAFFG